MQGTRGSGSALVLFVGVAAAALFATMAVLSKSTTTLPLVWHVQTLDGSPLESRRADEPINPASVVKVATTLWALERLGPEHRFETRFGIHGSLDPASGVLDGDLLVEGTGDPDFHVENAYLVARELNRAGLREVSGSLRVDDRFWIGWEGGSARRQKQPRRRAEIMSERLREAFDPTRWTPATRNALDEFASRRGWDVKDAPRILIGGGPGRPNEEAQRRRLVVHRSNPLKQTLKRFNSYSNNDIERLETTLGSAAELATFLVDRWGLTPGSLQFETLSGLGKNRMTSRQVVRLLDDLRETSARLRLDLRDLLPVAGCDPGTLEHFTRLGESVGALVAKTGTLTTTDGGVAVLSGLAHTGRGEILFCVAAPRSRGRLAWARDEQQHWLLQQIARGEGWRSADCGQPLVHSDDRAEVLAID